MTTTAKKDPSAIYSAEWFTQFPALRDEFRALGTALFRIFKPRSVVDIGCGPGMVLERMRELGCIVHGVEGSLHGLAIAAEAVRPHLEHRDITAGGTLRAADLVICTEVAEHLEAEHSDTLVDMIASASRVAPDELVAVARPAVFFTAAPPGQGGHDHVNEQPMHYWLAKFALRGLLPDIMATRRLHNAMVNERPRDLWAQHWLFGNAVVLSRASA